MHDLLTARDLADHLQISRRTIWRWTAAGVLPQPLRTGVNGRVVRWRAADIQSFLHPGANRDASGRPQPGAHTP
jgi:predicted DNA-binding transcriptional regulator AlpA